MTTSADRASSQVKATGAQFQGDVLQVSLNDGREIGVPFKRVEWLQWLASATEEQRAKWSLEPGGFAIYWDDLDDGIEISRLLDIDPLA